MDQSQTEPPESSAGWRVALQAFDEAKFQPNSLIPHDWFWEALGIPPISGNADLETIDSRRMRFWSGFSLLRQALLEERSVALKHFDFEFNEPVDDYLDRWCGMVINFRPSTGDDGFIKMWIDDRRAMTYIGPTRQDGGEGPYFKHGLYFWGYERFGDAQKRALVYHDRLRIGVGCGYDAVDPNRW